MKKLCKGRLEATMGDKLLLWQQRIVDYTPSMSNEALFEDVLQQASGDDYDGCFTIRGWWKYEYLANALRERLTASGFFK